jgi:hypothetical protein
LIELTLAGKTRIAVAEALAVLLQTWNELYYQFRPFTEEHFHEIEKLLQTHLDQVLAFRNRSMTRLPKPIWKRLKHYLTILNNFSVPSVPSSRFTCLPRTFFRYGIGRLRSVIVAS